MARNDSVTVTVGSIVKVDVLANDRIALKKAKAQTKEVGIPDSPWSGLATYIDRRERVVVKALSTAAPGKYTYTYKAVDAKARADNARVTITVVATKVTPPPPAEDSREAGDASSVTGSSSTPPKPPEPSSTEPSESSSAQPLPPEPAEPVATRPSEDPRFRQPERGRSGVDGSESRAKTPKARRGSGWVSDG